uniref:Uncharacterized protein n=1 Tax=Glossina pallidipes TaxID=7398 RepID=A0A1A9Z320_GLOPL
MSIVSYAPLNLNKIKKLNKIRDLLISNNNKNNYNARAAIVFSKIVKVYQEILANFIVQSKDVRVKELLHKVLKKLTYVDTYARTHTNIYTVQCSSESKCNSV